MLSSGEMLTAGGLKSLLEQHEVCFIPHAPLLGIIPYLPAQVLMQFSCTSFHVLCLSMTTMTRCLPLMWPSPPAPIVIKPQVGGVILGGSALLRACGKTHFGARKLISEVGSTVEDGSVEDGSVVDGGEWITWRRAIYYGGYKSSHNLCQCGSSAVFLCYDGGM